MLATKKKSTDLWWWLDNLVRNHIISAVQSLLCSTAPSIFVFFKRRSGKSRCFLYTCTDQIPLRLRALLMIFLPPGVVVGSTSTVDFLLFDSFPFTLVRIMTFFWLSLDEVRMDVVLLSQGPCWAFVIRWLVVSLVEVGLQDDVETGYDRELWMSFHLVDRRRCFRIELFSVFEKLMQPSRNRTKRNKWLAHQHPIFFGKYSLLLPHCWHCMKNQKPRS